MKIHKILNNNVAVAYDDQQQEKIVMGKGICFQKRVGDSLEISKIDKTFLLSSPEANTKFQQLVKDVPLEYIELGESIIQYAKLQLGKKLNDMIYVSLIDHIYFSITRFQQGILVKNALLWDIKRFYPYEFEIGIYTIHQIEQQFDILLPQEEAGFIALHLVNAEDDNSDMDMYEITHIMQALSNIVTYTFNVTFHEDNVYYYRFITHLKFFAQRLFSHTTYQDEKDDGLLDVIKQRYQNSYMCVCKIEKYLLNQYQYQMSNEEKLYLTIHIERVVYKSQ